MSVTKDKILLIDGNSILNRAFYALPLLTNREGEYTNGVYGFLNIFMKFMDEEQPKYAAVAFDLPKPTFRHEKFEDYKGTRKKMPEEMRPQIALLQNLLIKMRVKTYMLEGYEADDLLGTLAVTAEQSDLAPVVVTGDRDLLQIATDIIKIRIPKTKSGKTDVEDYFAADVCEKIGVTPAEFIEVKALMGDASDNIPGVPSIGEKTALKIIQAYHTVENSIAHAEEIKPARAGQNLRKFSATARLSKELATICTNAAIDFRLEEMGVDELFNDEAYDELIRLECKSILVRFPPNRSAPEPLGQVISDQTEAETVLRSLPNEPCAFQMIWGDDVCLGMGLAHSAGTFYFALPEPDLLKVCASFWSGDSPKITRDAKKTMVYLAAYGIKLKHVIFDAMLAGYLLDASSQAYEYSDFAYTYLNETAVSPVNFWGKGKSRRSASDISTDQIARFACRQADILRRVYPVMREKLEVNRQWELYEGMEAPLTETLADMEVFGIKVNPDEIRQYGLDLQKHLAGLTNEIYALAGEEFNIHSTQQLGVVLFEKLGLKSDKKTKQGYSTAADVLEKLTGVHPIVGKVLEYRTYSKLKSTYADGLLNVMDTKTSKIFSTFHQTIAATGRISSTEPNLQNIPIRLEPGRQLRKAFVPTDESFVFLSSDYSQIELRVLAHLSGDQTLINAFREEQDIHRLTASQVFNIPFDEVTPALRSGAKAVNFGIVYGISAFSLSQDLAITRAEAQRYIDGYFAKYPQVKEYLDQCIATAREKGYAETMFNRRRPIPEINSGNFTVRAFGERVAMNMPVQGTAADIIKIAMVNVHKRLRTENRASKLILQVHDELLLEAAKSELDDMKSLLRDEMEKAVILNVPLIVDIHEGETWYEAK